VKDRGVASRSEKESAKKSPIEKNPTIPKTKVIADESHRKPKCAKRKTRSRTRKNRREHPETQKSKILTGAGSKSAPFLKVGNDNWAKLPRAETRQKTKGTREEGKSEKREKTAAAR